VLTNIHNNASGLGTDEKESQTILQLTEIMYF